MKPVKISVYIPSHNYGRFLTDSIESVLRQSYDNWELLLIDDNSTDNTAEVMNRYQGDARLRIFNAGGVGLHAVCNLALKEARGEYIIRLDADDIFEENILLILSHYLDQHPDIALVFPDHFLMDEFGDIFSYERRQKIYQSNHMLDAPPNGACFLARTEVLREVGGYKSEMRAQDGYYIWLKVIKTHKTANINLPLYYYRRHSENLTTNSNRIYEARRKIKRDLIINELDSRRPIIAVIPCRQNYDFCQDLWDRSFRGTKLIERTIEMCLRSDILDRIVVACDNPDAESILKKFSDPRLEFHLRSPRETIRSESVQATLEKVAAIYDPKSQGICAVTYVQAPFVTTDTLEESIFTMIVNEADSSIGVEEINRPLFKRSAFGLRSINPHLGISSDFQTVYAESRSIFATRSRNLKVGSLFGPRVVNFLLSADETFLITTEKTFQIAAILSAQHDVIDMK